MEQNGNQEVNAEKQPLTQSEPGYCVFRRVVATENNTFWARVTGLLSEKEAHKYLKKNSRQSLALYYCDGHSLIPFKIFENTPEMTLLKILS